jgi:hypothetical protein
MTYERPEDKDYWDNLDDDMENVNMRTTLDDDIEALIKLSENLKDMTTKERQDFPAQMELIDISIFRIKEKLKT